MVEPLSCKLIGFFFSDSCPPSYINMPNTRLCFGVYASTQNYNLSNLRCKNANKPDYLGTAQLAMIKNASIITFLDDSKLTDGVT